MILKRRNDEERYDINELELPYNSDGVLFVSSPAATLGYYKREKATEEITYIDNTGKKWINTGDVFSIDEKGFLFFKGRVKRIVVRPDGHNIPTNQIESIGNRHPSVENAIVVGVPSKKYSHGSNAALCLSIKNQNLTSDELIDVLDEIRQECVKELQPRDRAKYYLILKNIPFTMNGKVDYKKIIEYASEMISKISMDENSQEYFYFIDDAVMEKNKILKIKKNNIKKY